MALSQARKSRKTQVSKEDFKTQEGILLSERDRLSAIEGKPLTMQDVRVRMATRVAAGEMPTLANATTAVGTGSLRIDSITINKSNDAFVTLDISATGYPNVS